MKKVVFGYLYNTATATKIASWNNGFSKDLNYLEESLYITKKGNFFLVGAGGPLSKYVFLYGHSRFAGSDLIPLSKNDAMVWLEEKCKTEVIEKYFSDSIGEP